MSYLFLLNLVLLLWIFYVFVLSCVCYVLCASVYMCFVVTCWERADLLALVCGVFCEFVTFPLVSWVRCGTWLYRFLIFATLLLRNSKWCSVASLIFIYYSSDQQRLWSGCAYTQAGLGLCWSHMPYCWKCHVAAHVFWPCNWPILRSQTLAVICTP